MKLKLTVDGKVYEVDVEVAEPEPSHHGYVPIPGQARVPAAAAAAGPATPATPRPGNTQVPVADEGKVCRSPFSGVVTKVSTQVGQDIQINDVLMVLEAMKMETVITAPIAGKVARIIANVGDPVQQGQVLVEFE